MLSRCLPSLLFAATLATLGCHAQTPALTGTTVKPGTPLSLEESRRVEVLLRQKANLPPMSTIHISVPASSEVPGFSTISITFESDGKASRPITFLVSNDGATLAQLTKYTLPVKPREMLSSAGRPARGGTEAAPVIIVGFDDLECPYCARLHESIFPLLTQRYGDKVRFVYKDFPLEQHPWAMHAALDVNCVAEQSTPGYWNMVDYVHAHASEMGADPKDPKAEKTLPRATEQLDALAHEQAKAQKLDDAKLTACIKTNDTRSIAESQKLGTSLGIEATPSLFINGDKVDGAVPVEFIFQVIDDALRAEGVTPPAPYVEPKPAAPATPAAAPAAKAPSGR
ncbi:DsbA family protein [Bryocella elongata]|uniref:DsbA family protein n=1 Tax=Bryocella elongata TaxID=863522 RepID=UPI001F25392F|nr:thioredoxin domain-containing protein [Bryocella elongata]